MKRKHVKPTELTRSNSAAVVREGEGSDSSMGTFNAVLASDGEASDGHILHIPGLATPKRMPLLFGHKSEITAPVLGSVTKPVKGKTANGENRVLRTKQVINMEGEGQMADIRRNLARLVHDGDMNAMSLRWLPDFAQVVRRIDLARNHYAYVDPIEESRDSERYWGFFHKVAGSQEGSVVAIGADPLALEGRAQDMGGRPGSVFFRTLARSIESGERADGMADLSNAFAAYTEALDGVRKAGVSPEDIALLVEADVKPTDMVRCNVVDEGGSQHSMMIPRVMRDALLRESVAAYQAALDLYNNQPEGVVLTVEKPNVLRGDALTPEEADANLDRVYPVRRKQKREVVYYPCEDNEIQERTVTDMEPGEFFERLGSSIGKQVRTVVNQAMGKIED